MLYSAILSLHIGAAVLSAIVAIWALLQVARGSRESALHARLLNVLTGLAAGIVTTGAVLAVISPVSAISLCDNLLVYLTLHALIAMILARTAHLSIESIRTPASLLAGSTLSFVIVVAAGF